MAWQPWHVAPGQLPNKPHSSWFTWNGGEATITLCALTPRSEWRLCSHESEVANVWHSAIASVRQPWQRAERTGDGQLGKSSGIPCRQPHAQLVEGRGSEKQLRDLVEAAQ
jgi:hypothetical protein